MKRFFNKNQRSILAWISGGSCAICSVKLNSNFHADHIQAFVNGGKTITKNGQALCQKCNLSKGAK
jgi:5-methylcytosine-specific restriction endonuclease McrA